MNPASSLIEIANQAGAVSAKGDHDEFHKPLDKLRAAAEQFNKAWSGSWLGYQARVYYLDFTLPPPGARFSQDWGLRETFAFQETLGKWQEYSFDEVIAAIFEKSGGVDLEAIEKSSKDVQSETEDLRERLRSKLSALTRLDKEDVYLSDLLAQANKIRLFTLHDVVQAQRPTGNFLSHDLAAIEAGIHTPPHIFILARVQTAVIPFQVCKEIERIARRASLHLTESGKERQVAPQGRGNIFIGHGRAQDWKELRDFIRDRLQLPWDEFNRIPIAGVTNIARLHQMLGEANFAFLVMTAEDEDSDGALHARLNVIHEAGLFQGRLGFEKAILLLENGCGEFSNIQGLGQVRFPKGKINMVFEEVRLVLEREQIS